MMIEWGLAFIQWLAAVLPPAVSYRLAEWLGDLAWLVARQLRADVEHNQRRAIGPGATPRQVARNSRQVLRRMMKVTLDEFRLPALSDDELRSMVTIHGLEHLQAAHAEGRGVIVASAHYGGSPVVGQLLAVLGFPTAIPVEHMQPEALFRFMCRLRSRRGIRLVPVDQSLLPLLRTLRREHGIVAMMADRDATGTGQWMPFLGEQTRVADGAVRLALRLGVPLLVAVCCRRPTHRYEALIQPPLALPSPAEVGMEQAVREGTARLAARLEALIREQPTQWLMTVPLWREGHYGVR